MGEGKQLAIVLILTVSIAALGIYFANVLTGQTFADLTADYTAKISIDKNLTLVEDYIYHVKRSNYRMLFRVWRAPMIVEGSNIRLDSPHIVLINAKAEGTTYAKDNFGNVFVWGGDGYARYLVETKAERNEVGFIRSHFLPGSYEATYKFKILPPIESDGRFDHINLKLADVHVPYPKVTIIVDDPQNAVVKLYPHMVSFDVRREGTKWIIEGTAPANSLVELEMLLKPNMIKGYIKKVDDVVGRTERANTMYYLTKNIADAFRYILTALVLAFPIFVIYVYNKYGKERSFTVPEFLSFVPKKRKPWIVNLVFKGDAFRFDKDGFYATLLDLQRRGFIEIEPYDKKELRIRILRSDSDDRYERSVLEFLTRFSEKGVFDTKRIKYIVKKDRSEALALSNWLDIVMNYNVPNISEEFVDTTGKSVFEKVSLVTLVALVLSLIFLLPFTSIHPPIVQCPILLLTLLGQSLACYLAPSQLFGRWKEEFYKEKLEWDAFRRFLSDMAMIKKYAPKDLAIWKDWLIYGTALGVGENVVKAMNSLNISIPEILTFYGFATFHSIRATAAEASGGGFGGFGGGFGAGGGFGGGGAGGR